MFEPRENRKEDTWLNGFETLKRRRDKLGTDNVFKFAHVKRSAKGGNWSRLKFILLKSRGVKCKIYADPS